MWKHPKPKKMLSKWFWSNSWSSFPNRYTLSSHQSGPYCWDFFRRTSWKLHMTVWIVSYSVVRYGKIGVKTTFVLMICWFCKKLFIAEKVGILRWSSLLLFRYLQLATFGDVSLRFPLLRLVSALLKVQNQQEYLRDSKTCLFWSVFDNPEHDWDFVYLATRRRYHQAYD